MRVTLGRRTHSSKLIQHFCIQLEERFEPSRVTAKRSRLVASSLNAEEYLYSAPYSVHRFVFTFWLGITIPDSDPFVVKADR